MTRRQIEQNASEVQYMLWETFMANRWRYYKAGWRDPYWPEIERRWNELIQAEEPEPEPLPQAVKPNGTVYFLLDQTPMAGGGYRVKIGNGDSEQRKRATTLPHLLVIWEEDGGRERERELHGLFARDRIAGSEWFRLSDSIRSYLEERNPGCLAHLEEKPTKRVGRPRDVPTATELAYLLQNPDSSNKDLWRRFGWRNSKAKRFKEYAAEVRAAQLVKA